MENRVDHANPFTNQIFQEAVIRSDMAIVKLLLRYGIYPKRNERNRQGLTALQQCVLDGNGRMAILLLEAGADIEAKTSNGWTSLHIASALGDLDILTTLVNHCCDLVALTKNEELPIDLAASRDIKIKLAKEMSRIGYSELAQWYMRKLAAREGVFYVLSTDTLLDLACDEKEERSYDKDYLYYAQSQGDVYIHSPVRKESVASSVRHLDNNVAPFNKDIWFGYSPHEQMTYLTYSSGYISEVVFDPASGQYSNKMLTSTGVTESPQRKIIEERISLASISEVDATPMDDVKSRSGTLKRTPSAKRHSQSMNRKPSTIELHIDYMQATESEDEGDDDAFEDGTEYGTEYGVSSKQTIEFSPSMKPLERLREVDELGTSSDTLVAKDQNTRPPPPEFTDLSTANATELKNKNVKFNPGDTNNEFCNCPNCKKLGYAFSPDIRAGSRKAFHLPSKSLGVIPQNVPMTAADYNRYYYPDATDKNGLHFDQSDYHYKAPKRKKKLFSGIKSMFKESIKVRTNAETTPACDDAGILFSVSLRDKNKAKSTRQRNDVRRSNSFSGVQERNDFNEEVPVIPHSQVVAPPHKFSDLYQQEHILDPEKYHATTEELEKYEMQFIQDLPDDFGLYSSRNIYDKRLHNNTGQPIADTAYYPQDDPTSYFTDTSLPHGFHYSRPTQQSGGYPNQHLRNYSGPQTHCDDEHMRYEKQMEEFIPSEYDNMSFNNTGIDNCVFCTSHHHNELQHQYHQQHQRHQQSSNASMIPNDTSME